MRLYPKLLLSFIGVILTGVVAVSYLVNTLTAREVHAIMVQGGMTTDTSLAQELAGYYRGHGGWDGVDILLDDRRGMGSMMGQQLLLADAQGRVIVDTTHALTGQTLTDEERATGVVIDVAGEPVGTLIVRGGRGMMGGSSMGNSEQDLLTRVTRATWLAALMAGSVALVVGGLLAYSLVRPIQRLTAATRAVAQGDLAQRVPVKSNDEIGDLATSFNTMADSLQTAEHLRREMTADIAHELRNPLTVLQGNLEAVLDGVLPPTDETLQPLLDQTRLLTRLVEDLRTLALAEAGQLDLQREPTDVVVLVHSVIARFRPPAEAKHIVLQVETPPPLPVVMLDAQRIEQVLSNLLSNAIRHTPAEGVIRVQLLVTSERHVPSSAVEQHLQLTVTDTGPGILPDSLPHIFERFYRVERSRSRADGGTGLGLAIAKQLVEAHGGHIWATSGLNTGTTVTFTLPLDKSAVAANS